MKLLIISDCHSLTSEETSKLQNIEYDVCFLLGDICDKYIKMITQYIPKDKIFGVLGNHDEYGLLEENDIQNIHLKTITINGLSLLGYEGSNRYKRGKFVMHTQEECEQDLFTQPSVDILISHEGPYELYSSNFAHCGFKGITDYLEKNECPLNIHGHQHIKSHKKTSYGTDIICVYKCAVIDTETLTINHLF